ncbi:MAG: SGNH/GDSL hydrolase family protein, partial [Myxococcales bacterium]|nr:SGNH/GDSL hydrolase family protein [Myxococcales bacterium]
SAGAAGAPPVDLGPTRYPSDRALSPITPHVADALVSIAAKDASRLDDVFVKVGASGTVNPAFLYCFAGPSQPGYTLDLDAYGALMPSIVRFRGGPTPDGSTPFDRQTLAAKVGMSASWAISGSPSPLDQEISALNPRFAFVNYGTNDMQQGISYESALWPFAENLSKLLDQLESGGIVPIISGLNPRGDSASAALWVPTYDAVTRGIAEARQLPYLSLYLSAKDLPDQGLVSDGIHGNAYVTNGKSQPCVFTGAGLDYNYNRRNLASMQLLDVLSRVVVDGENAPDVAPPGYEGDGSIASPIVIDQLPFTHAASTAGAESTLDAYSGCTATQDESGPEVVYSLTLSKTTALRAMVFDRDGVDVDLHLTGAPASGGGCIARHDRQISRTLAAGTYSFVVDSFVSGGVAQAGAYLFVVVECAAGDPDCG